MFGLIIIILVLSSFVRLIFRPFFGYYRPRIYPFGGFGGWGWGMGYRHGPHCCHRHHMGHGRRW